MHRFFADETGIANGTARLSAEDSRHALRVLRLDVGDEVELVCEPAHYLAGIAAIEDGVVTVAIRGELRPTEAKTQVTLYQGLPKADKMELIAQKTTELGVYAIRPVAMERCVVKLEGKDAGKKIERWQKIAREAVKQCARTAVPEMLDVKKLTQIKEELAALAVDIKQRKPNIMGYTMADGRIINLLAEGRLVNLAAGNGHPAEIMDMSFAVQALSLEWLAKHHKELEKKVYDIPAQIDDQIGRVKLAAMGFAIDELTEEQKAYLAGWEA